VRIALYSHDTQGLGHVRRNLLIASALARRGLNPIVLLLSGVHEAAAFEMPAGVDCITLPSLGKDASGVYFPRSLGVGMKDLIGLRRRTLGAALRSFQPDLFIVDKVPGGAFQELLPALRTVRSRKRARIVLGWREILDDAEQVERESRQQGWDKIIREYYDHIWVYGDQRVFDPVVEYNLAPDIAAKVRFTGYLNPLHAESGQIDEPAADLLLPPGRLALCVVGGGRDGVPLAEAFIKAPLPASTNGVVITGPLMPAADRARLRLLAAGRSRLRVLEFVTNPLPYLRQADCVISMAGYNTMCEVLAMKKHALIVPRTQPRLEQLMRAERFASMGAVEMLHPDLLTPAALAAWIERSESARVVDAGIDLGGYQRLPRLLDEVLESGAAGCRQPVRIAS
jgi:predicted glycosyltransferase